MLWQSFGMNLPALPPIRLYEDITIEEIRASAAKPLNLSKAVKIVEVQSPVVEPPPPYNRGINWRPGR